MVDLRQSNILHWIRFERGMRELSMPPSFPTSERRCASASAIPKCARSSLSMASPQA
jgi:hypothetical protein